MSMDVHAGQPQRLLPQTLEDLLLDWLRRAGGALALLIAAAAWLAILTWSYQDPSLSHSTSGTPVNWLGMPGAVLSDLMLNAFGLASIFLLIPLVIVGLQLMIAGQIAKYRLRLVLGALAIPSIAAGMSALPNAVAWKLPYGYGGALGDGLFDVTSALLAVVAPKAGGAAAGLAFFIFGFWAFTRTIGLDRRKLFEVLWISRRSRQLASGAPGRSGWGVMAASLDAMFWGKRRPRNTFSGVDEAGQYSDGQRPEGQFPQGHSPDGHSPHGMTGRGIEPSLEPVWPATGALPTVEKAYTANADAMDPAPAFPARSGTAAFATGRPAAPRIDSAAPRLDSDGTHIEPRFTQYDDPARDSAKKIAERFAPGGGVRASQGLMSPAQPIEFDEDAGLGPAFPSMPAFHETDDTQAHYSGLGPIPAGRSTAFQMPSLNLLHKSNPPGVQSEHSEAELLTTARQLQEVLADFRVLGEMKGVRPGPVVTMYEFEPARGTKASRIIALADDIARSMSATSARIAVVPGRNVIGIELPNPSREQVGLRDLMEAAAYRNSEATLPLALGKGITGEPCVADLARMPHLLVAGTTGSGKSVGVNAMILSLLYRRTPDECRFLMIDPKMLELSVYNGIPHLLTPVVTDPMRAVAALNWAVGEMEERYKRMAELGVRNIDFFNTRVRGAARRGETLGHTIHTGFDAATGAALYQEKRLELEPMPHIVIVVDEFADLMAVAGKEIELAVRRLAQKARASGIHLIMATQRPSVDVVTGTIKANFPTRISFKVASRIDSRTILNEQGAEQLLGQGDMLFSDGGGHTQRLHGPFVSDDEVQAVSQMLRDQQPPNYIDGITDLPEEADEPGSGSTEAGDDLYQDAVAMVLEDGRASTSYIQRRFGIGYNRAANLLERMEADGIVSKPDRMGRREVLTSSGGQLDFK